MYQLNNNRPDIDVQICQNTFHPKTPVGYVSLWHL